MIKEKELSDPNSCLNKAKLDEFLFILRDKDPTMKNVINFWIDERIRMGLNTISDSKINEAMKLIASIMSK